MCNMTTYQTSDKGIGQFHSGFLEKAKAFLLREILNQEDYNGRNIIFCGHSMGGAVASIVSIFALMSEKRKPKIPGEDGPSRMIRCITFGSPLIGCPKLRKVKLLA